MKGYFTSFDILSFFLLPSWKVILTMLKYYNYGGLVMSFINYIKRLFNFENAEQEKRRIEDAELIRRDQEREAIRREEENKRGRKRQR